MARASERNGEPQASPGKGVKPPPPGAGVPLYHVASKRHQPDAGFHKVYDGAYDRTSISARFGTSRSQAGTPAAIRAHGTLKSYHSSFNTKTPRPWQAPLSRHSNKMGPGDYGTSPAQFNLGHSLASTSVSWGTRGRSGPVGQPFELRRPNSSFTSSVPRFGYAHERKALNSAPRPESFFMLRNERRQADAHAKGWGEQLATRMHNNFFNNLGF